MIIYETLSIAAFLAALVWTLLSRNPFNVGALFGGLLLFGFDWLWCGKGFFNATFAAGLLSIPGIQILGERYPFAVACNWAVGFGLVPLLVSRVHASFGRVLGMFHFPVIFAAFAVFDLVIEIICVSGLGVWTYHQAPAYLLYGVPWSNTWLLGGLLTLSYFGLAWLRRWVPIPDSAGFCVTSESTWKGIVLSAAVIWAAAFFLTVVQLFWYSAAMPWVLSGRLF